MSTSKTPHHPSFTPSERASFMAQLAPTGYKYYPLATTCEVMFARQGRPSQMPPPWRAHVITMLTEGIGHCPAQFIEFRRIYKAVEAALMKTTAARDEGYRKGYNDAVEEYRAMMHRCADDLLSVDESAA